MFWPVLLFPSPISHTQLTMVVVETASRNTFSSTQTESGGVKVKSASGLSKTVRIMNEVSLEHGILAREIRESCTAPNSPGAGV